MNIWAVTHRNINKNLLRLLTAQAQAEEKGGSLLPLPRLRRRGALGQNRQKQPHGLQVQRLRDVFTGVITWHDAKFARGCMMCGPMVCAAAAMITGWPRSLGCPTASISDFMVTTLVGGWIRCRISAENVRCAVVIYHQPPERNWFFAAAAVRQRQKRCGSLTIIGATRKNREANRD